ncbi:hypothetical protein RFI_28681, partial [Reticulomyxa filosa]
MCAFAIYLERYIARIYETTLVQMPKSIEKLFQYCECHQLIHHAPTDTFILILASTLENMTSYITCLNEIYDKTNTPPASRHYGKVCLQFRVDLQIRPLAITSLLIGGFIVDDDNYRILCYDETRQTLILENKTMIVEENFTRGMKNNVHYFVDAPNNYIKEIKALRFQDCVRNW